MKIYTAKQHLNKLRAAKRLHAKVLDVKKETISGVPSIVIYLETKKESYGVILDRQHAHELTRALGPHPLVEEFFRVH